MCRISLPGHNRCVLPGGVTHCSTDEAWKRACRSTGCRMRDRWVSPYWSGREPRPACRTSRIDTHRSAQDLPPFYRPGCAGSPPADLFSQLQEQARQNDRSHAAEQTRANEIDQRHLSPQPVRPQARPPRCRWRCCCLRPCPPGRIESRPGVALITCPPAARSSSLLSQMSASRGTISRPAHARAAPMTGMTLDRKGTGADEVVTRTISGSGRRAGRRAASARGSVCATKVMAPAGQAATQAPHPRQSA